MDINTINQNFIQALNNKTDITDDLSILITNITDLYKDKTSDEIFNNILHNIYLDISTVNKETNVFDLLCKKYPNKLAEISQYYVLYYKECYLYMQKFKNKMDYFYNTYGETLAVLYGQLDYMQANFFNDLNTTKTIIEKIQKIEG